MGNSLGNGNHHSEGNTILCVKYFNINLKQGNWY